MPKATWVTACALSELEEGKPKYVDLDGRELAVCLDQGEAFALDNECPHAGGSMSGGWVEDGCAVCPWHSWAFDLRTGHLRGAFAGAEAIKTYPTRTIEHEGERLVQVEVLVP